jgi:hypothetical protein
MRQRRDALHLDRVHLFQRVVKDPRRVDDLPSKVLVVQVPHKKRFCRERVRLDIDVRARDLVDKRRFTDVRIAAYEEGARVRVDRRQTRYVLSDLLEVRQGIFLAAHDSRHSMDGFFALSLRNLSQEMETAWSAPA